MLWKAAIIILLSVLIHLRGGLWKYETERKSEVHLRSVVDNFLAKETQWGDDFFVVMDIWGNQAYVKANTISDVTVATQCSVNNLRHLPEMATRWNGLMTVVLFAPRGDFVKAIIGSYWLRTCLPRTFANVSFHLLYPTAFPPTIEEEFLKNWALEFSSTPNKNDPSFCNRSLNALRKFEGGNYMLKGIQYPHNSLRNVAISAVETEYVLLLDVDTFPGIHTRENILRLIRSEKFGKLYDPAKSVFITPAFEAKNKSQMPKTKGDVIQQYWKGNVRPFYAEICHRCRLPTKFINWLSIPENNKTIVVYETDWNECWEPFYVARTADLTRYNESFKQYGYDRISQVCETFVAGYRYFVLNNAFVVHDGFKIPRAFHSTKDLENRRNHIIYRMDFVPLLASRYPNSNRTCADSGRRIGRGLSKYKAPFMI